MKIVDAMHYDMVRVDLTYRAHTVPAELAIAMIEVMQYAVLENQHFETWGRDNDDGTKVYSCRVGNLSVEHSDIQQAVLGFWEKFVIPNRS